LLSYHRASDVILASKSKQETMNPAENKNIRMKWNTNKEKWYFVIADIVKVLTQTNNAREYVCQMHKQKTQVLKEWQKHIEFEILPTEGGLQPMKCTHALGLLHFIDAMPSRRAKPFNHWLRDLRHKKSSEYELHRSPQFLTNSFPASANDIEDWIQNRIESLILPHELQTKWQLTSIAKQREHALLVASISNCPFRISDGQWIKLKQKIQHNSSTPISDLEIIFAMLGKHSLHIEK
jgi:BRO family, N-terminal domain